METSIIKIACVVAIVLFFCSLIEFQTKKCFETCNTYVEHNNIENYTIERAALGGCSCKMERRNYTYKIVIN